MKKTVTPLPWVMIFFGVLSVLCIVLSVVEFTNKPTLSFFAVDFIVAGVFVYEVIKYRSQKKIFYDETEFTVGGVTYAYTDITDITVDTEMLLRNISTLKITVYISDEEICSFTKSDSGAKDFIAIMKKHGVSVTIDI